jgi:hypothetical protein
MSNRKVIMEVLDDNNIDKANKKYIDLPPYSIYMIMGFLAMTASSFLYYYSVYGRLESNWEEHTGRVGVGYYALLTFSLIVYNAKYKSFQGIYLYGMGALAYIGTMTGMFALDACIVFLLERLRAYCTIDFYQWMLFGGKFIALAISSIITHVLIYRDWKNRHKYY